MEDYLAIAFVVSIIIYPIVYLFLGKRREKISFIKKLGEFAFIGYLVMLILVTLVMNYDPNVTWESNLIPLKDIVQNITVQKSFIGLTQFNFNIIMFMPLGTLLPIVIDKKIWSFKSTFKIAFVTSFAIEICQYFIGRALDVDDIIANSIGGAIGYELYVLLLCVVNFIFNHKHKSCSREEKTFKEGAMAFTIITILMIVTKYSINNS